MKSSRKIVWLLLLLIVPVIALSLSLYVQFRYLKDMHRMRDEQFTVLVNVALKDAVEMVERETLADYTNSVLTDNIDSLKEIKKEDTSDKYNKNVQNLIHWNQRLLESDFATSTSLPSYSKPSEITSPKIPREQYSALVDAYFYYSKSLRDVILNSILSLNNDLRPLREKINLPNMERSIRRALERVGITEPFALYVYDERNNLIGSVRENEAKGKRNTINTVRHYLFENIILGRRYTGYIELTFYERDKYIERQDYIVSMAITTFVLLLFNVIGVIYVFGQLRFERNSKHFADNLTHELKTPLASILIATDMLGNEDSSYSSEQKKRMLKALRSETKRLNFLVEKMLQFTQIERGQMTISPTKVNAHEILEDAYTVMSMRCEELGGKMTLSLGAKDYYIYADKTHFQNIVFNILDNALKYKKTDVPPEVAICTSNSSPKELSISISDNGVGIYRRDRKRIFKRYVRLRKGDLYEVKGFGLGLCYVKNMMDTMKGKIRVTGKKDVGTTMTLIFPLAKGTKS